MKPNFYAKAGVGAILAGLGALATGLADGIMEPVEWVLVASATVAAFGVVYGVPNEPAAGGGKHSPGYDPEDGVVPPDYG